MPRMILVDLKGPSLPRHPYSISTLKPMVLFLLAEQRTLEHCQTSTLCTGPSRTRRRKTTTKSSPSALNQSPSSLPFPSSLAVRTLTTFLPSFSCRPQRLQVGEPIAPSPYQTYLSSTSDDPSPAGPPELANPRYWSDYNRVFYHPRSLLPLEPRFRRTTAEGENGMAKWDEGLEAWDSLRKVRPPTALNQTPSTRS